ncbi:MAG: tRNA (adenosine(37)-N6)-threonylcarbamoyltransferase complex ATPase subunit type 1 TsaE [Alphaproteobacteria bacterium]
MLTSEIRQFLNLTEAELCMFGARLAPLLESGDLVTLSGELGVGKSVLSRAMLNGLGIVEVIPSPTFTLVQSYRVPETISFDLVAHVDLYRLDHHQDVIELGLEEYLDHGVVLLEWPERLYQIDVKRRLDLRIEMSAQGSELRNIMVYAPKVFDRIGALLG